MKEGSQGQRGNLEKSLFSWLLRGEKERRIPEKKKIDEGEVLGREEENTDALLLIEGLLVANSDR